MEANIFIEVQIGKNKADCNSALLCKLYRDYGNVLIIALAVDLYTIFNPFSVSIIYDITKVYYSKEIESSEGDEMTQAVKVTTNTW